MTYLDHNATTTLSAAAREAWLRASEEFIGNPSSPHRLGSRADRALTEAREELAAMLGCDALDIVWTSGATEANNLVVHHVAQSLEEEGEMWLSAIEHPCVLEAAKKWLPERHRLLAVTHVGAIDVAYVANQIAKRRPALIGVMAANNETGVLQPWAEVMAMARAAGVPFFCDAAQWLGKMPAKGLGAADFVSGCAHKFGGPKGVGFLKCPGKGKVHPLIVGGPQEEGRRAGTENVAGVVAMLAALREREAAMARNEQLVRQEAKEAFEAALVTTLPGSEIVGSGQARLWNTVSALMPEADCQQRWVVKLDKAGFAVSTGSACASGKEVASHVLTAMGYGPSDSGRALRFSAGWETPAGAWNELLAALKQVHSAMGK
ncbi:MAG: cysteine desulfurase [Verrucomicrobia bacterium]|nr:cysteine desulfurase [Verrucomicrobiota bacterium]